MKIVLASRNKKKIKELETLLGEFSSIQAEVLSLDDIGYTEEIAEDGASFLENALIKAAVPAARGYIGIADDSGLTVDALDGAPGIYSARYAGEGSTDGENNRKLLAALADTPDGSRGGAFVSVVACVLPQEMKKAIPVELRCTSREGFCAFAVRGECRGEILWEGRGEDGFGYDPLFYYPPLEKTFAELSAAEKNAVSHRGMAMREFVRMLNTIFAENED